MIDLTQVIEDIRFVMGLFLALPVLVVMGIGLVSLISFISNYLRNKEFMDEDNNL